MKYDLDKVIKRTGTDCVKWDHYEMRDEVPDMIPMSIADMDFKAPDFITGALEARVDHGIFGYTVVPESYYNALTGWLKKRSGWEVKREWIRFCPGVIPAINFAVQAFTEPGDGIIIQPPVYHPFRHSIANNSRVVVNNPLIREGGRYRMDLEGLKKIIDGRTRMIILSSPHNPVGRVWEKEELLELSGVCLENGIIILSDEIHSDLIMPGRSHTPTAMLSDEAARITVTCTSPSKTFNLAELHTANIIIPDHGLFTRFDCALVKAGLNKPNIFGMAACQAAYANGEDWVFGLTAYINDNYFYMKDFFEAALPRVRPAPLEGTYLAWLDMRDLADITGGLEKKLLKDAGVAMVPGRIFGPGGEGFFRMNLACPRSVLKEALGRISRAFKG